MKEDFVAIKNSIDSWAHYSAKIDLSAVIGKGVVIGPDVIVHGGAYIGSYSVIGMCPPEHKDFYSDFEGKRTKGVVVMENARIWEFVSVHPGTKSETIIGVDVAVQNHSHIGHDCELDKGVTIGGHCSLAGHVLVQEKAIISGRSNVHQWVVVGAYSLTSAASFVNYHLPPGETWAGVPARPAGINEIGLMRAEMTHEECLRLYGPEFDLMKKGRLGCT